MTRPILLAQEIRVGIQASTSAAYLQHQRQRVTSTSGAYL